MSRLKELYEKMVDEAPVSFHPTQRAYIMELAEIYAKEVAQASLQKASQTAEIHIPDGAYMDCYVNPENIEILKSSITNVENITML